MSLNPWPALEPTEEMVKLTFDPLPIREISDVDYAFPSQVNPDPMESPRKYWSREGRSLGGYENPDDPWIRLANAIIFHSFDQTKLKMPTREASAGRGGDVWRWVDACARSYKYRVEIKAICIAWILESHFWAYWLDGEEPDWVLESLTAPDEDAG